MLAPDRREQPFQEFSVRVEDPVRLYEQVANTSNRLTPFRDGKESSSDMVDEMVSLTLLDNHLFQSEVTHLRLIRDEDHTLFWPMSKLILAQEAKMRDDSGFYSDERLEKFTEELKKQGLIPLPEDDEFWIPPITRMEIPLTENDSIGLTLDFKSRRDYQNAARYVGILTKKVPDFDEKQEIEEQLYEASFEDATSNFLVCVMNSNIKTGDYHWPILTDASSFAQLMELYASAYQKVLIAFYRERGLPLPRPIVLHAGNQA